MDKQQAQYQLEQILRESAPYAGQGRVATYIPELAHSNPHHLGVTVTFLDGTSISAGDAGVPFTLQSISKLFSLIIAIEDCGFDSVFSRVGKEPTGDPFNSIVKLETIKPHKPLNPMINAGAIAVCSLIKGNGVDEKLQRILQLLQKLSNCPSLRVNEDVYLSEKRSADRNRALAYFMRDSGIIEGEVEEVLDLYFRHCAIELTTKELSRIAAVFATDGRDLQTGEQIIPTQIARVCKTFMVTCGMYNASGEFAIDAGIPAKSGVSGGILSAVPHKLGIGVYGPALDEKGNSMAGVKLLERLAQMWQLSIF